MVVREWHACANVQAERVNDGQEEKGERQVVGDNNRTTHTLKHGPARDISYVRG